MKKQPVNTVQSQEIEALAETLEKLQSIAYKIVTSSDRELKEIEDEFLRLVAKSNSYLSNQYPE